MQWNLQLESHLLVCDQIYWLSVSWGPVFVLSTFSHQAVRGSRFGFLWVRLSSLAYYTGTQQVKYLKLLSGQDLQYPLMGGNWAIFLINLGHHVSPCHIPYFKLKFSLALSIGTYGGFTYFSVLTKSLFF